MSFEHLCRNGTFLEPDFNGTVGGIVVGPKFYENQLNGVQRTTLSILFCFLSGSAIVGNSLALFTIYKRKLQILYKCCIVSQCIGDFLMAVFVGFNSLNNFISDTVDWKLGDFMCGFMPYVTTLCALLSSMILTCIAIERYQGVVLLVGKWDPKLSTAVLVTASLWVVSAGTTIPTFLSYNLKPACFLNFKTNSSRFSHLCLTNKTVNNLYFISIFTLIFLPLLVAFVVLYTFIARLLWEKKKQMNPPQASGSASTLNTSLDSHSDFDVKPSVESGRSPNEKKKLRTFFIILVIVGTFIVCRLPQWIFLVVTTFPGYRVTGNFWWTVKYLLSALSLASTAINPFIYPFLNDVVNLKSSLSSSLKNLKKLKLRNLRVNVGMPSTSK